MSSIKINIDISKATAKIDNEVKNVKETLVKELNKFAILTVSDAKRAAPVDEGFLRNAISMNTATLENLKSEVIVAANYAAYIEFGTRSFAAAYVGSLPQTWQEYAAQFKGAGGGSSDFILHIMEWVKRKGIPEAAAYPIARKILRFGIRPHPFLFPAVQKNFTALKERLKQD